MPRHLFSLKNLFPCLLFPLLGLLFIPHGHAAPPETIQKGSCLSQGWPHEGSDLPVDPSLLFGTLDNGLRYVLKNNREPRNRVAMYLNVQAGSLQETEAQRGVAHFLEHMLFNGTSHYPPGTLVEYFQSIGMEFGADTNAHTGYDETVYKLVLPATDDKTLADGLLVLADYARRALLLEQEVERERGVILAEKRSRNSALSRTRKEQLAFDFAGTLVAERDPIGLEHVIEGADSTLLRSYYDAWYRPENMILVIVGDVDPARLEPLLRQYFADLAPASALPPACPDPGSPAETGVQMRLLAEPELGYTEISIASLRAEPAPADTLERETVLLHRYLALVLLNNRLQQLERDAASPLTKTMAYSGPFARQYRYSLLSTRTEADTWDRGLQLLYTTLEQALRHGFSEAELERGRKEVRAMLEKEAQTADARDSRELAMELIRNLNDNEVSLSPAQKKDLFIPLLERSDLAAVQQALRDMWPEEPRTVTVAGTALQNLPPSGAEEKIRDLYTALTKAETAPWQRRAGATFPYLPPPAQAQGPVSEDTDSEIDVQRLHYARGLIVHLKKTAFKPNQVLLSAHFGRGRQGEPAPGAALLAQGLVQESGTATMTRDQLRQALAGTTLALDFAIGPESCSFSGSALSSELETLLQLLYARLHDPAFRPEAFSLGKERLRQMYAQMGNAVEGVYLIEGERFLTGASASFGMPSWEELDALSLEQLADWLRPLFSRAPLEINIVGDIDIPKTRLLLDTYFGAEQRDLQEQVGEKSLTFPFGRELRLQAPDSSGKAQLGLAWKTDDFWDIERTRRLNILAAILDDRLRLTIREELGAAYSPRVMSRPSRTDPGFGLLESRLVVDPLLADELAQVVRSVAERLGRDGIDAAEFKRAQEPTLTAIRDQLRSNSYWLQTVLALASRHPEQLQWPRNIAQSFAAMRVEEVEALARRYLQAQRAATVVVLSGEARKDMKDMKNMKKENPKENPAGQGDTAPDR